MGQIPSPIQLLVTIESPRTLQCARKKIWGLFPKTCFRWNGPLHESLKNISYFGLEFSRDLSGVDSVIESMRNLFWSFLITYRKFFVVAFVTPNKVHQIPFQKTFEQKRAPEGCSFCECVKRSPAPPPAEPTRQKKVTYLAGPQWQLGGRRVRLWRSVETGEGAPSVRKNIYLYYFSCRISRVLENWRSEFPNFLHAAPYGNSKDTLLPRFAKILLCVDLWGKWGAKMVKNTIFDKNLLLTLFWLRKWGILTRNGWK